MLPSRRVAPPATRLARRRLVDRVWEDFVRDGVEPSGVREAIAQSWRRAREEHRIDPGLRLPTKILSAEALASRCDQDEVLSLARPVLAEFAARLGRSEHVLAYFDGDGWMLYIDGHPGVLERVASEIGFRPGVNWGENSAGTNGPGTALAERKAIEVFASEHFVAAWQAWSCAAAPVFAPGETTPVGLVDITGRWEVHRDQALVVARAIARTVEERLQAALSVRDEVVRHVFRAAHESGDALVAVDARGRVLVANEAASRRRVVEAGSLPPDTRESLAAALRGSDVGSGKEIAIASLDGTRLVASPVCYAGAAVGAIVRSPSNRAAARPPRPARGALARYDFGWILGHSRSLQNVVELAQVATHNDLPVLLFGESGTGKELFAHAIHSGSKRRDGPFIAVNCGSIPSQLVEAELFGYEAGTFTGGQREGKPGRFEDAHGGTLFLDEVSELSTPAQTALLRVLQEKEVVRVGSSTPRRVDVRIIAATNKPLDEEIQARRFRRDLYYRLNVLSISVPPLRDRGEDVVVLAQAFLAEAEPEVGRSGLSLNEDALARLREHPWPGNVRELRNVILRAAATAPLPCIRAQDLLLEQAAAGSGNRPSTPLGRTLQATVLESEREVLLRTLKATVLESERDALLQTLEACSWNVVRAAQRVGVSRVTLYRRMEKWGISRTPGSR